MDPYQALELLNQLRLKVEMNGADHELARKAYETLRDFIQGLASKKNELP